MGKNGLQLRLEILEEHTALAAELRDSMADNKKLGRKCALLACFRPVVEACLKGLWYAHVATPEQILGKHVAKQSDLMRLARDIDAKVPAGNKILQRLLKVKGSDGQPLISVLQATAHSDIGRIQLYQRYELDDVMRTTTSLVRALGEAVLVLKETEWHVENFRGSTGMEPTNADLKRFAEIAFQGLPSLAA